MSDTVDQVHGGHHRRHQWELYFALASGVAYISGLLAEFVFKAPAPVFVGFYLATYFLGGYFTVKEAWSSIRRGRFEVDFLMIVAAVGAAAVGKFAEGAVLLFLFSLGHALEEYALSRASKSIDALAELAPRTALVRTSDGHSEERLVEDLVAGDIVIVKPNSRVPADGFVIEGTPAIDQAAVTGESFPVKKFPVVDPSATLANPAVVPAFAQVFAGTITGATPFEMMVTAAADDTTLARVVKMVREADTAQSPTQLFVDKFQRYYVPIVILSVAAVLGVGVIFFAEPFSASFYRAMLVLVAASPCALAIATPAAALSAIARAGRAGMLVKGGAPLEIVGKVNVIAFDKTGTLTWGIPTVTDLVPTEGTSTGHLAAVVVAVESLSDHPLAAAITRDLTGEVPSGSRLEATQVEAVTGRGVRAELGGERALVGNLTMMDEHEVPLPKELSRSVQRLQRQGRTTMVVALGGRALGVVALMDTPKQEAKQTVGALRKLGISEMVLISGDNQRVAEAVGASMGMDQSIGELLPEHKVAAIRALEQSGNVTAMVGDGVNDSPAMAAANVGIAMGAAGSAVALETADIALMSDDIGRLPFLVRLARETTRIVRQNLIASALIVGFLVPASLLGLSMGPIVLIHEGSTIIVIFNALRLLNFERHRDHAGIDHEEPPATSKASRVPAGK